MRHTPDSDTPADFQPARLLLPMLLAAALCVTSAIYYSAAQGGAAAGGFPLDDAWIHLQFARNLAEGHGFSFNPGVPSSGSTAPLWTVILAVVLWLGLDDVIATKVIGTAFTVVTALAAARIAWLLTASRLAALVGGAAIGLSPRFAWGSVSGMEVPLYSALVALAILVYLADLQRSRAGMSWAVLAALAGTARPEAFLLLPILFVHRAWTCLTDIPIGQVWRPLLRPFLAATAVVTTYVTFNLVVGGHPLPTTFYAKGRGSGLLSALVEGGWSGMSGPLLADPVTSLSLFLRWADEQGGFLSLAALVGALVAAAVLPSRSAVKGGGIVIVTLFLLTPIVKATFAPEPRMLQHDGRYVMHLLVMYFAMAAAGVSYLWERSRRHWVIAAFVIVALGRLMSQDIKFAPVYAAQVRNIDGLQVRLGEWIASATSPDAVIATNDIGAPAYFGRRMIIDTEGLITPEAIPFKRAGNILPFIQQTKPDLLIIFPEWYPELSERTDLFTEIGRVTSRPKVIAAGESLVIYTTPWTRPGTVRHPPGAPQDNPGAQ
jgi:arabinofuranosyltransferase